MASNLYSSLLVILLSFASPSFAEHVPVSTICESTPDPSFCKSLLPQNNKTANVDDYGRYSIQKSLSESRKFLSLVDGYLTRPSTLSTTTIRALEDCKLLAQLIMDFLLTSSQTVNTTSKTLPSMQADNTQTLLSAILTSQQTCLDGLQSISSAYSITNGLSSNGTKSYSLSLALFTKGWVPKEKQATTWRKHLKFRNGRLPLKMSSRNHQIYEFVSRRNLLQTNNDQPVLVSNIVIVSKDGSGNFTTINDAVASAPNNTDGSNGYFLIYVSAGVYAEYVSIATNKRDLMMIGDGINQTILTGNRSVGDGWTTFNSATFGLRALVSTWGCLLGPRKVFGKLLE